MTIDISVLNTTAAWINWLLTYNRLGVAIVGNRKFNYNTINYTI